VAPILRHLSLFSGNTILGDGSVIMILDPNGIAASTGEMTVTESHQREAAAAQTSHADERTALLVFRAGAGGPKAVPLSLVARLEEFDLAKIEYSHDQPMVQYREQLMPLVPIDPTYKLGTEGRQPVLVFSDRDRAMGLIVDEIVDIVEDQIKVQLGTDRPGFLGSAIIGGHATDIIDAGYYLTRAYGDWFTLQGAGRLERRSKRILLIDDSPFFRNLLTPLLSVAGYDVTTAESGNEAMSMCEAGLSFDLIVSDIEMPGMSGFEFAEAVRRHPRWRETPLVALSSHTAPDDLDRGRAAGFNDYIAKFDRDALLQTLAETLVQADRGMVA
jgi:two-component system chemotaxis sensor kinase CheA